LDEHGIVGSKIEGAADPDHEPVFLAGMMSAGEVPGEKSK
jgi:hypothetical protein